MKKCYPLIPKNRLRASLLTAFAVLCSLTLQAQIGPSKNWDKTIGGNFDDELKAIKQTADGGYILVGSSLSQISGEKSQARLGYKDFWVVRLDATGNKIWDKTLGTVSDDYVNTVIQTPDGGFLVGGTAYSANPDRSWPNYGQEDYWLIKLNASGIKQWDKSYGGTSIDRLMKIVPTTDGGYLLAGYSTSGVNGIKTSPQKGFYDFWIVKIDSLGTKLWDKAYGGSQADVLFAAHQTADGGYILAGTSNSAIGGDKSEPKRNTGNWSDYWVIKVDGTGNKQWDKTLGSGWDENFCALEQTADGGYLVGGTSYASTPNGDITQPSKGGVDYWIVKLNAAGNKVWDKFIGGTSSDDFRDIKKTQDGNYILLGSSHSPVGADKSEASKGGADYWIVKIDPAGNKIWDKTVGGLLSDLPGEVNQTADGGFILAGSTSSDIGADKTEASRGLKDFWIVKLGPDLILGETEAQATFNLSIYPNPSQGKFKLQLNNLPFPEAEVIISDLLGRKIFNQKLQGTGQHLSHDLTLPRVKGIYLLQLRAGEKTINRKIVIE